MRMLWILGGDPVIKNDLERSLDILRVGVPYKVKLASSIDEVPEEDLAKASTTFLLNAFHQKHPGFEGLRALRKRGFKGAAFLFGEPATDGAIASFQQDGLTGYFPSFDTADLNLVAGVIHYQTHFEGMLDIKLFLKDGGRASIENIRSFKDYNAFGAKLATFVSKFGVDINQLKKVLMGLSLGHIKTSSGGPEVETPFPIFYGMDPQKLVIAAPTFSRGANREAFMKHFCEVVHGFRNQTALPGSIFPELFHVGRAAENLVIFSGNYQAATETMDPVVLMATLPFNKVKEVPQAPYAIFAFCHSQPLQADEFMHNEVAESPAAASVAAAPTAEAAKAPNEVRPSGLINPVDMKEILNEPRIIGDVPVNGDPSQVDQKPALPKLVPKPVAADGTPEAAVATAEAPAAVSESIPESTGITMDSSEADRLRALNQALAQDVRRLMKERRQPTTDRELRDAVEQIQEKLKRANIHSSALDKKLAEKTTEIEALKAQIETLRKAAA